MMRYGRRIPLQTDVILQNPNCYYGTPGTRSALSFSIKLLSMIAWGLL